MIFVTVGTDQPFDRMLKVIDAWAATRGRKDVFAQIGKGGWQPSAIPFSELLSPPEFKRHFASAQLVIAHAGMGTILSALNCGKPILVMPKLASLGEHRNEHQLATARRMMSLGNVTVAFDEAQLLEKLENLDRIQPGRLVSDVASGGLIKGLRDFIFENGPD